MKNFFSINFTFLSVLLYLGPIDAALPAELERKQLTKPADALFYFWSRNDAMGKSVPDTWRPYQAEIGKLNEAVILKCEWDNGDGTGHTTYNWFRKYPEGLDEVLTHVRPDNPIKEIGPPLEDCT